MCVDYRKLNTVTLKDAYLLSHIADILESLAGTKFFSTMDLSSGYCMASRCSPRWSVQNNIHNPLRTIWIPSTIKTHWVCASRINRVILSDIIVFSQWFEEHIHWLRGVFSRLKNAQLKIKPSKCFFFEEEITYLGHVVSRNGIGTYPSNTTAIKTYPVPRKLHELHDSMFSSNFAEIASPLHCLRKKSKQFIQTQECQNELKETFSNALILAFSSFDIPCRMYIDASDCSSIGTITKLAGACSGLYSCHLTNVGIKGSTTESVALAMVGHELSFSFVHTSMVTRSH